MKDLVSEIGYDNWQIVYRNRLFIDLIKYFTKEELELLKKFNIKIKNEVYTEFDYDAVKTVLAQYYIEEDFNEEERKYQLSLDSIGVTQEQYNALLKKFDDLDERYQKWI